jgi:4-amino-4-deoxy-L-arabinose transferase-like glycosyltransferase
MIRFWRALVILTALVSIWFLSKALWQLWGYFSLNAQTKAEVFEWKVVEKSSAQFRIEAQYHFHVQDIRHEGKTQFSDLSFLNPYAAEGAIDKLKHQDWTAWYNQNDPNKSSLQKIVPFKACFHAILTLGVLVYFFFLKNFLRRMAV